MAGEEETKDQATKPEEDAGPGCLGKTIKTAIIVLVLILLAGFFLTLKKVEPAEIGLRYWNISLPLVAERGDVNKLDPGYSVIIPYLHEFNKYDCTIHRFEMAPPSQDTNPDIEPLKVRTAKDQDEIDVYVTILYHVDRQQIETNIEQTGETGLRENYSTNKDIKEQGIKAICPQVLQARLGEIMTANQFYSMTKKKKNIIKDRINKLKNIIEEYRALKNEKEGLEQLPRKSSRQLERAEELEKQLESLEKKAEKIELETEEEASGEERTEILASELDEIRKRYPTEQFFLSRKEQVKKAKDEMDEFFNPRGIEITAVLIWDFKFKDRIEASIISKVIADESVEMEKALKQAAEARAEWQRLVANANAAAEAELARGTARSREIGAEADKYMMEKIALGDKIIMVSQAEGKGKTRQALSGKAGQVYVGLEYAKALEGIELIILPAGGPNGINPLDLGQSVKQIQPGVEAVSGGGQ